MPFDIAGAKEAGYSDADIADFLSSKYGYNAEEARKAGYSDSSIVGYLTENEPEIAQGRVKSAAKSLMRQGGADVGRDVSFLGRITEALAPYFAGMDPSGMGLATPSEEQAVAAYEEQQRKLKLTPAQREAEVQRNPIYRAGREITAGAEEAFKPSPRYRGEFLSDVLPSGLGGMVPTIAASAVNPALGALQYAGTAGEAAAQEAIEAGRPELAQRAAMIVAPIGGATELMLGAAPAAGARMLRGAVPKEVERGLLRSLFSTGSKEALQEGSEQILQNLTASTFAPYDPERKWYEGVPESAAAGFVLGAGVEGGVKGVEALRNRELRRQAEALPYRALLESISETRLEPKYGATVRETQPVGGVSYGVGDLLLADQIAARRESARSEAAAAAVDEANRALAQRAADERSLAIQQQRLSNARRRRAELEAMYGGQAQQQAPEAAQAVAVEERDALQALAALEQAASERVEPAAARPIASVDEMLRRAQRARQVAERNRAAAEAARAERARAEAEAQAEIDRIVAEQLPLQQQAALGEAQAIGQLLGEREAAVVSQQFPAGARPAPRPAAATFGISEQLRQKLQAARAADEAQRKAISEKAKQVPAAGEAVVQPGGEGAQGPRRVDRAQEVRQGEVPADGGIRATGGVTQAAAASVETTPKAATVAPPRPPQKAARRKAAVPSVAEAAAVPVQVAAEQPSAVLPAPTITPAPSAEAAPVVPAAAPPSRAAIRTRKKAAEPQPTRYVRVRGTLPDGRSIGQSRIAGEMTERDGRKFLTVVEISPQGSVRTGLRVGSEVEVGGGMSTYDEDRPKAAEAPVKERGVGSARRSQLIELINSAIGSNEERFAKFKSLISKGDTDDNTELRDFEARLSKDLASKFRAAVYLSEGYSGDSEDARMQFHQRVYSWLDKRLTTDKSAKFNIAFNTRLAESSAQRATAGTVEATPETVGRATFETAPTEMVAAEEEDERSQRQQDAATIVANVILDAEKSNGGKKLTDRKFRDVIARLLSDLAKNKNVLKQTVAPQGGKLVAVKESDVDRYIRMAAQRMTNALYDTYSEGGAEAIRSEPILLADSNIFSPTDAPSLGRGKYTVSDAIDFVLKNTPEESVLHEIARRLKASGANPDIYVVSDEEMGGYGDGGRVAFYNADSNTIYVRESAQAHDYLVMHEVVHAATVARIKSDPAFRKAIMDLRAASSEQIGGDWYGFSEHGSAWKNAAEFVGEALSNPQFQEKLKQVSVPSGESLWSKFVSLVAKVLGIDAKGRNALEAIMDMALPEQAVQKPAAGTAASDSDAQYMSLAGRYESGDESALPELQRMVDEAAKNAGYKTDPMYHGSPVADITTFRTGSGYAYGPGVYMTPEPDRASRYGKNVYKVYLRWSNPVLGTFKAPQEFASNPTFDSLPGDTNDQKNASARSLGHDSVVKFWSSFGDGNPVEVVVFDPSQVKSANPVIRDQQGNIIPLSRRFNPESDSILEASRLFKTRKEVDEAFSQSGNVRGEKAITAQAQAVSGLIPADTVQSLVDQMRGGQAVLDAISRIESAASEEARAAALRQFAKVAGVSYREWERLPSVVASNRLSRFVELGRLSDSPTPLQQMPVATEEDVQIRREAAFAVDRTATKMEADVGKSKRKAASIIAALTDPDNKLQAELKDLKSKQGSSNVSAKSALDDYAQYVRDNRLVVRASGTSIGELSAEKASAALKMRAKTDAVASALLEIAEKLPASAIASAKNNGDIVKAIIDGKVLEGNPIASILLPDENGRGGILMSYRGLISALGHISELSTNRNAAVARIDEYEKKIADLRKFKEVKSINIKDFASMFSRIRDRENRIASISSELAKLQRGADALIAYADALEKIISTPQYSAQRAASVEILDKMMHGTDGKFDGNYRVREFGDASFPDGHPYGLEKFKFLVTANDPKAYEKNLIEYQKAIGKIDAILSAEDHNFTPEFKNTMRYMRMVLMEEMDARPEGTLIPNQYDVFGMFRRLPIVRNYMTANLPAWLMSGPLGYKIREMQTALDTLFTKIKRLRSSQSHGITAIQKACEDAFQSHANDIPEWVGKSGEDQREWWKTYVLEDVLGQNQNNIGGALEAGQYTKQNIKVTKEDVVAAQKMATWNNELRKIVEQTQGAAKFFPTRIVSPDGTTSRLSYASGSLTVPRILNRHQSPSGESSSPMDLARRWLEGKQADRMRLMGDSTFFEVVVLPHVAELNPEYTDVRKSSFGEEYKQLARKWRNEGTHPSTLEDLVSELADTIPSRNVGTVNGVDVYEGDREKRDRIISTLASEVNAMLERHSKQVSSTASDNSDILSEYVGPENRAEVTVLSQLDAENSFRRPRLSMVAPSTFYNYELASPRSFGALEKGATLGLQISMLKMYQQIEKQISSAINELEGNVDIRNLSQVASAQMSNSGGDRFKSVAELKRLLQMFEVVKSHFAGALNIRPASSESRGLFSRMLSQVSASMLTAPAIFNFIQGSLMARPVASMAILERRWMGPLKVASYFTDLVADTIAGVSGNNPALMSWINRHKRGLFSSFLNSVVSSMEASVRANALMPEAEAGVLEEVFSKPEGVQFDFSKGKRTRGNVVADAILTAPLISNFVRARDAFGSALERATTINAMIAADRELRNMFALLSKIIELRAAGGKPGHLDFDRPENNFTREELRRIGITDTAWARMLVLFSTSQKIEKIALDYYKRAKAARLEGGNWKNVPWTEDQAVWDDIVVKIAGMTNLPLRSNRPDIVRERSQLGDIARMAVLFPGYSNGLISTLQLMQSLAGDKRGIEKHILSVVQVALVASALALLGLPILEIKALLYRLVYGRPYPAETLSSLVNAPTPQMAMRVLASAVATTIPYLGESIASAVGAQNYRGALTDLSGTSLPLKLIDTFVTASKSLATTGDVLGAALSIQRGVLPLASPILNRLPGIEERNAITDAVRVAKVNRGDLAVTERGGGGGGGAQPTEFSNLVRRAVAAQAGGDSTGAADLLRRAAKVKQDAGDANPWGAVRSAVAANSPSMKAFGRKLTDQEEAALVGRMTGAQRAIYSRGKDAVASAMAMARGMAPAKAGRGGRASMPGMEPLASIRSKIAKVRKEAVPKAVRDIRSKLRSMRVTRKPSASTGSRLLRPVRPGAVGPSPFPSSMQRRAAPMYAADSATA